MNLVRLRRIERIVLFFMVISLPFVVLPQRFSLPGTQQAAVNVFSIVAVLLLIYEYIKFKFLIEKKIVLFLCSLMAWQIFCLVHGLYVYKFENLMLIDQFPNVNKIFDIYYAWGGNAQQITLIKIWRFLVGTKDILIQDNILFFSLYYVYHLYKDNSSLGFSDIRKGIVILFLIMGSYSFVELLWLKFSLTSAGDILQAVNPYLYDPVSAHGWWPPLLWKNQLRSICAEPSFFGVVGMFMFPFLWSYCFKKKTFVIGYFMSFYFSLMLFATNSRTAIVLTLGEVMMLGLSFFWVREKYYIYRGILLSAVIISAFCVNLLNFKGVIPNVASEENTALGSANQYVSQNVESVAQKDSRSNNVRINYLIASGKTVYQYPVFGVGYGLKDAYIEKNIPQDIGNTGELALWKEYMHKYGIFKFGYGSTNKYTEIAMSYGMIGFGMFFVPLLCLLFNLIKYRSVLLNDYDTIFLCIIMVALLAAFFSSRIDIVASGMVWGLLYCKLNEKKKNHKGSLFNGLSGKNYE